MSNYIGKKLFITVVEGDLKGLKKLVSLGANINHVFPDHGDTLLHYAHTPLITSYLLLHMAKTNVKDRYGQTPLCCAAAKPNGLQVVKLLIEAGADVNVKMLNGITPLHYAPTVEMTKLLLYNGADPNAKDKYGRTPLHSALINKKGFDVFKCLLDNGADINTRLGVLQNTVLHLADSLDIVRLILSKGVDVNALTIYKQSPLHYAIKQRKELPVVRELLKCGALVRIIDNINYIPIYYALRHFKTEYPVIKLLVEYDSIAELTFRDTMTDRIANVVEYMVIRDMELSKTLLKLHVLCCSGIESKVKSIAEDACSKKERDFMLKYRLLCCGEVVDLKKNYVFDKYSYFDLLVDKKVKMKPVFKSYKKLEQEMVEKFPLFYDLIMEKIKPHLERGMLMRRLKRLQMSVKTSHKRVITLNSDCTRFIIPMLPDDSLMNLLKAWELIVRKNKSCNNIVGFCC